MTGTICRTGSRFARHLDRCTEKPSKPNYTSHSEAEAPFCKTNKTYKIVLFPTTIIYIFHLVKALSTKLTTVNTALDKNGDINEIPSYMQIPISRAGHVDEVLAKTAVCPPLVTRTPPPPP
jgi:hypothetical protein